MFESFLVLFIVKPWNKGDFIGMMGKEFTTANISLYTTTGYDPKGVYVR